MRISHQMPRDLSMQKMLKPGLTTLRAMEVVLVHKLGQNKKKVDDLKKRADVLVLFQEKLALLH